MLSGNSAVYLKTLHAHGLLCLCSNVEKMADLWVSRVTIVLPKSSSLIILVLSENSLQIAPTNSGLGYLVYRNKNITVCPYLLILPK